MGACYSAPSNDEPLNVLLLEDDISNKDFKSVQTEQRAGQQSDQQLSDDAQAAIANNFYADQQQEDQDDNESEDDKQEYVTSKTNIWDKLDNPIDKQKYEHLMHELDEQGLKQYKDKEFPPELKSIAIDINSFPKGKKYKWCRASEFSGGKMDIFVGKIEPNDIKQGSLGDCYFLSSLSAMAEKPNLISRLFKTNTVNEQGLYCIWLCCDGQWKQIVLDDYFPCQTNSKTNQNEPAFSSGNGPELWVLLLEKAYAKVHGCYANIEAGLTGNAIRDLTGAPYEFKSNEDEGAENIWKFLQDKDNINKFICTAGSNADQKGTEVKQDTGIISGHAYAILDAQTVKNKQGQDERIIQLRNPWGSNEWTGAWSDKSDKWTPELKKQCNWSDKNDGIFWMPIEDFCKDYSDLTINYVHEDFHYSSFKVECTNFQKYFMLDFTVDKKIETYISLSQKNKKCYFGQNIDYDYSMVSLIVFKKYKAKKDQPAKICPVKKFVKDDYGNQRDTFIKHHFDKGQYTVMVNIEWCQKVHSNIVVSAYSACPVKFNEGSLKFIEQKEFENYIDFCIPIKKTKLNLIVEYKQAPRIYRSKGKLGGYIYYLYVNKSKNIVLNEICNLRNRDGLTICAPELNSDSFSVEVPPNEDKFVKYRIDPEKKGAYSYGAGYQTQFRKIKTLC